MNNRKTLTLKFLYPFRNNSHLYLVFYLSTFTIPLEPTLSKIHKELQRASRSDKGRSLCDTQFSLKEKSEARNAPNGSNTGK